MLGAGGFFEERKEGGGLQEKVRRVLGVVEGRTIKKGPTTLVW